MKIAKAGGHGAARRRHHAMPMAEINIIPLVDITLVLLIIFMATTAFVKESGINLNLPRAKNAAAAAEDNKAIDVALTRDGGIYLSGKASSEEEVQRVMSAAAARNPNTRVIIKGDENVAYKRIIAVMDMARGAGLPKVALGTRVPEGATDAGSR
jgi:biopolymer transport protein ExbD